jgi:parallel beta-helix repeat protein
MLNVRIEGNLVDASGSLTSCGGGTPCTLHGILVQDTVAVPPSEYRVLVKDNRVIGARINDPHPHIIGTGIWVAGAPNTTVEHNYVQRTYDGIKFTSARNFEMLDNEVVSTGFTANTSVLIEGSNVSGVVRGNTLRIDPASALAHGEDTLIVETAKSGAGVTYSSNRAGGIKLSLPGSRNLGGSPR